MIDREKALAYFRHREAQIPMPGARAMYQEAIKALEQHEVILCKDCNKASKCYGDVVMRSRGGGYIYCPLEFCSEGERRTDE
jgi:hypothetical protein